MRVFTVTIGFILPILIIGGRIVDFEGPQPSRHIHLSYNRDRIPVENFDGVVIKAHSLGNSGEIRKAPVKTYVQENYGHQQPVMTGVVGQAPQSVFTGIIGKVSQPNNLLQNPFNLLLPNGNNLLATPNHIIGHPLLPQPILRADQLPNNQVPPGYVFVPGPLRPNGLQQMAPSLFGAPTLISPPIQQQLSLSPGQVVTVAPNLLSSHNNHFTPIPGFPTFPPFTMPPAFHKLVPEAREAKEKAERKYSPIKSYHSEMDINTLESRLPKTKRRSSKHRSELDDNKSQVWMVPYYN
uniref:Uncharacterized protein n=1 Tax=Strongyloides papillosus TaxID=174720 RepID=A0A0N5BD13_STREA